MTIGPGMGNFLDPVRRFDELLDAAVVLLCEGGFPALTMRRLAAGMDLRASTLIEHYRSKSRILLLLTYYLWRRHAGLVGRRRSEGVAALVPRTLEELEVAAAWLAVVELGRHDEAVARQLASRADEERALLRHLLDTESGGWPRDPASAGALDAAVDVVATTAWGLLRRRCDLVEPLEVDDAERILRWVAAAALAAPVPDEPESAA